jgi:hypothetical protein
MVDARAASQITNLLICIEMLIASVAHFYIFPYEEWAPGYRENREEMLKAVSARVSVLATPHHATPHHHTSHHTPYTTLCLITYLYTGTNTNKAQHTTHRTLYTTVKSNVSTNTTNILYPTPPPITSLHTTTEQAVSARRHAGSARLRTRRHADGHRLGPREGGRFCRRRTWTRTRSKQQRRRPRW